MTLCVFKWFEQSYFIFWKILELSIVTVIRLHNSLFKVFPFLIFYYRIIWNLLTVEFNCIFFQKVFKHVNSFVPRDRILLFVVDSSLGAGISELWNMIKHDCNRRMIFSQFLNCCLSIKDSKNQKEIHHWLYYRFPNTVGLIRHDALYKHANSLVWRFQRLTQGINKIQENILVWACLIRII